MTKWYDIDGGKLPPNFGKDESSLFKMPPPVCTNPEDARSYSNQHCKADGTPDSVWGEKCPVHYHNRKRPVPADNEPPAKEWVQWVQYRELFATTEDDEVRPFYLEAMLNNVTETIPPNAGVPLYWMKRETVPVRSTVTVLKSWIPIVSCLGWLLIILWVTATIL